MMRRRVVLGIDGGYKFDPHPGHCDGVDSCLLMNSCVYVCAGVRKLAALTLFSFCMRPGDGAPTSGVFRPYVIWELDIGASPDRALSAWCFLKEVTYRREIP